MLKTKLDRAGVQYTLCDDVEQMKSLGFESVPILDVNGKQMRFPEAISWINGGAHGN